MGLLEVQLEVIPKLSEALSEAIVTAQLGLEKNKQAERERLYLVYCQAVVEGVPADTTQSQRETGQDLCTGEFWEIVFGSREQQVMGSDISQDHLS